MESMIKKVMMVALKVLWNKAVVLEYDLNRETIACVATWREGFSYLQQALFFFIYILLG